MFCKSTEIVVTGSNVKRKAGPRVGSLGFISYISKDPSEVAQYKNSNFFIYVAIIHFYKYGYEKNTRFEKKQVNILVPFIEKDIDTFYTDKIKQFLKEKSKKIYLTVSPAQVDASFKDPNRLYTKIISKLFFQENQNYYTLLDCIITNKNDKNINFFDSTKIQYKLNEKNTYFLIRYLNINRFEERHKQAFYIKLLKELELTNDDLSNLFIFLNMVDLLLKEGYNKKYGGAFKKDYFYAYMHLLSVLFYTYKTNRLLSVAGGNVDVVKKLVEVRKNIIAEGIKVLNSHKRMNYEF